MGRLCLLVGQILLTQSSVPIAAVPNGPAAPKPSWNATGGMALIWLSGNASVLTFNANATAQRTWRLWSLAVRGFGTYGEGRPDLNVPHQVVALAAGGQMRVDRRLGEQVTLLGQVGAETNHVKSIELSSFVEGGGSITWFEKRQGNFERMLIRTDLAVRYGRELRFQYYPTPSNLPDVALLGPSLGVVLRYGLSPTALVTEELSVVADTLGQERRLITSATKLSTHVVSAVWLSASYQLAHDSRPAPGKKPLDTTFTIGVDLKWDPVGSRPFAG